MEVETQHTCQWFHRYAECQRHARATGVACEACGRNDIRDAAAAPAVGICHRDFAGRVQRSLTNM